MSLADYAEKNQTPAKASFPWAIKPHEEGANPKPHTSPDSETTGLSLTCKSASPLIPVKPLNLSDEKAETPRDRFLSSVLNPRGTGMSVFDLKRYCFFHLPQLTGSDRSPFTRNSLIHKVNFQHIRSSVKVSNVEISTIDNLPPKPPIDSFDRVSIRLGPLNAFSFKGKARHSVPVQGDQSANGQLGADTIDVQIKSSLIKPKPAVTTKFKPQRKKRAAIVCNCKNSKCLKLYCECFKSKGFCSHKCSCVDCGNVMQQPMSDPKSTDRQIQRQRNLSAKAAEIHEPSRAKAIMKASRKSDSNNSQKRELADGRGCVAHNGGPIKKQKLRHSRKSVSNENLPVLNSKNA